MHLAMRGKYSKIGTECARGTLRRAPRVVSIARENARSERDYNCNRHTIHKRINLL